MSQDSEKAVQTGDEKASHSDGFADHVEAVHPGEKENIQSSHGQHSSSAAEKMPFVTDDTDPVLRQGPDLRASVMLQEDSEPSANSSEDSHHIVGPDLERLESTSTSFSRTQIVSVMLPLAAGVFVASIDITIIVTALPEIAAHFESSQVYTWTGSSYALAHASTTTLWGMLSDIWGRKPILFSALGVFFVGSTACAFVDDVRAFIAGRALQGMGAGGLTTMANIVISDLFSLRERGLYFGILSFVMAFACGIGPALGGVFTERLRYGFGFTNDLEPSEHLRCADAVCVCSV